MVGEVQEAKESTGAIAHCLEFMRVKQVIEVQM